MNVRLYNATIYLWNLTTNFDETWHEVHPYSHHGSWKVSFDFTHKQKFFINNNIYKLANIEIKCDIQVMNVPVKFLFMGEIKWNFPRTMVGIWVNFMPSFIKIGGQVSEI